MQKEIWSWASPELATLPSRPVARLSRWGHYGTPVLLFPSAGGDCEEVERFALLAAIQPLVEAGRIKVFSVDGLMAQSILRGAASPDLRGHWLHACERFLHDEVVPRIRRDCHSDVIEILAAGPAYGAFSAVATLIRYPDVFRGALALSGLFDVPMSWPEGATLASLHRRFVQLASGEGQFEQPGESRRLADELGARGVPHHLDLWGRSYPHAWSTWREMILKYLAALT